MITPGKASVPIPPDVPRRGFSMRHAATSARPRDPRCVGDPETVRRLRRAGRKRNLEHPDLRSGHGTGDPPDHQARARQYVSVLAPPHSVALGGQSGRATDIAAATFITHIRRANQLLENGLIVKVEGKTGGDDDAWTIEATCITFRNDILT